MGVEPLCVYKQAKDLAFSQWVFKFLQGFVEQRLVKTVIEQKVVHHGIKSVNKVRIDQLLEMFPALLCKQPKLSLSICNLTVEICGKLLDSGTVHILELTLRSVSAMEAGMKRGVRERGCSDDAANILLLN